MDTYNRGKALREVIRSIRVLFFVSVWFTLLAAVAMWYIATAMLLVLAPKAGLLSLAALLVTLLVPLDTPAPRAVVWLLESSVSSFIQYLPVEIKLHGWDSGNRSSKPRRGPYIIAYEPHGVLPLIMCLFGSVPKPASLGLPEELDGAAILASDAVFWVPILRNLWYWLGLRSVARQSIDRILDKERTSVVLCPGGTTECLIMEPCNESIYLKSRKGFVHMSQKHGANIVPVFAVGQSDMYSYWRPFFDAPCTPWTRKLVVRLSKLLKFVPMVAWGRFYSPLPYRKRVTVIIGAPLDVDEEGSVEEALDVFIERVKGMYAGCRGVSKTLKVC
jgi:1-acyl-sn-glycerol-3-phosphate acyltransferase